MGELGEIERLKWRVEELVPPICTAWAADRERVWDGITTGLAAVDSQDAGAVLEGVLIAICNGLQYEKKIHGQLERTKSYEKERRRIEALLDDISDSEVVRQFSHSIEFYGPAEFQCPHGRRRKLCERLYCHLLLCKDPLLPLTNRTTGFLLRRVEKAINELKGHGVDPRTHTLDQLCCPNAPGQVTRLFEPIPTRDPGAPTDYVGGLLLDTVVGQLVAAKLRVRASCLHLADVRASCFPYLDRKRAKTGRAADREDVAETLAREWRKRRKEDLWQRMEEEQTPA